MVDLLERKLIFVTGKGGVGKTTIAAALAWLAASRGQRTLVCEVDAKGNLADFFETAPTRFEEREIAPRLWAMSMDTEASLKQYLSLQLKLPLVARVGPLAKMFDFVASAAPGVKEIVTVGKLCWEVKERHYDTVIVDASASGHIVSQLAAPQAINQLVQVGPVRQQTGWMLDILDDPATTGLVVVATPAEMPVSETLELTARLRQRDQRRPGRGGGQPGAPGAVRSGRGGGLRPAGRHPRRRHRLDAAARRARPARSWRRPASPSPCAAPGPSTSRRCGRPSIPSVPLLYVPYLFFRSHGLRATHQLADALSAELGY